MWVLLLERKKIGKPRVYAISNLCKASAVFEQTEHRGNELCQQQGELPRQLVVEELIHGSLFCCHGTDGIIWLTFSKRRRVIPLEPMFIWWLWKRQTLLKQFLTTSNYISSIIKAVLKWEEMLFRTSANFTVRDIMVIQALEGKTGLKGPALSLSCVAKASYLWVHRDSHLLKAWHLIWFSPFIRNEGKSTAGSDECVKAVGEDDSFVDLQKARHEDTEGSLLERGS